MDASPDPRNRVGGEERAESTSQPAGVTGKRAQRRPRPFDVGRYMARRVAMEVAYVGWHYRGLARQEGADDTIEHHLFAALRKTRLVPDDVLPEALGYRCLARAPHACPCPPLRCRPAPTPANRRLVPQPLRPYGPWRVGAKSGRDLPAPLSGVTSGPRRATGGGRCLPARAARARQRPSARTASIVPAVRGLPAEELDYVGMLNAVLPEDIQVLGWCPVPETFSARFDCRGRCGRLAPCIPPLCLTRGAAGGHIRSHGDTAEFTTPHVTCREYRYHMCSPGTQPLDVDRMRAACSALVGEHDFRNFCKADPNVPNHVRRILSCDVERVAG